MIYKEYFNNSEFEHVWKVLRNYYNEPESTKNLYRTLFYTIRNMDISEKQIPKPIKIEVDFENKIYIEGAPDPVEWLVGREIEYDKEIFSQNNGLEVFPLKISTEAKVSAHLLYWSTLYDFRTQTRFNKDFQNYLDSLTEGKTKYRLEDPDTTQSQQRKNIYFWKDTLANDSAIDWSYILTILRKRIEYHIGYHRFTNRFVRSSHYVSRMETCCNLLNLAASYFYDTEGLLVNTHNAARFIGPVFEKYHLKKLNEGKADDYILTELRRGKAYKILWKFIDHNLPYWWD